MLRVEASDLPKPRGLPRSRRLLPNPPMPRRVMTPAGDAAGAPAEELTLPMASRAPLLERWSVKLELGDAEIAKLYGQGMTRGAVVWKKGMVEWRPLLVTPELTGLLRRTRITIDPPAPPSSPTASQDLSSSPLPSFADELSFPRPARLPSLDDDFPERAPISTMAPTASDIEAPTKARRPLELLAVAAGAFALAWLVHAKVHPTAVSTATPPAAAAAMAAAPACTPGDSSTVLACSGIPTVSVADLPLAGARRAAAAGVDAHASPSKGNARVAPRTSSGSPSRSELVQALSRVAGVASSCGERGGPVRVVVSFAPSGVARSIQVSGEDLPSATRSCIIGAASRARVPAFTGEPVTVAKTL